MGSISSLTSTDSEEDIKLLEDPEEHGYENPTSFNRYDVPSVNDPYKFRPGYHYGDDKASAYYKKLITAFNEFKGGKLRMHAANINNILKNRSANYDILQSKPPNMAIMPGMPHVGPGNPVYYKAYNDLDEIARIHDIAYSNAESPLDIYKADKQMLYTLENTETNTAYEWFVKQVATYGIRTKHTFELMYGVLYPKFNKEQIEFMKENYPEYKQIMDEHEKYHVALNKQLLKGRLPMYNKLILKMGQQLSPSERNAMLNKLRNLSTKVNTFGSKLSNLWNSGAVWKDPYLRDITQWAEQYHSQQESSYLHKNYKKMLEIHVGFYKEQESYWKERLSILREAPYKQTDFKDLDDAIMKNLDEHHYQALLNYQNRDDRGWGHAFSYDLMWNLTEYHDNQFKNWLRQTYDEMKAHRQDWHNDQIKTVNDKPSYLTYKSSTTAPTQQL